MTRYVNSTAKISLFTAFEVETLRCEVSLEAPMPPPDLNLASLITEAERKASKPPATGEEAAEAPVGEGGEEGEDAVARASLSKPVGCQSSWDTGLSPRTAGIID